MPTFTREQSIFRVLPLLPYDRSTLSPNASGGNDLYLLYEGPRTPQAVHLALGLDIALPAFEWERLRTTAGAIVRFRGPARLDVIAVETYSRVDQLTERWYALVLGRCTRCGVAWANHDHCEPPAEDSATIRPPTDCSDCYRGLGVFGAVNDVFCRAHRPLLRDGSPTISALAPSQYGNFSRAAIPGLSFSIASTIDCPTGCIYPDNFCCMHLAPFLAANRPSVFCRDCIVTSDPEHDIYCSLHPRPTPEPTLYLSSVTCVACGFTGAFSRYFCTQHHGRGSTTVCLDCCAQCNLPAREPEPSTATCIECDLTAPRDFFCSVHHSVASGTTCISCCDQCPPLLRCHICGSTDAVHYRADCEADECERCPPDQVR